MAESRRDSAIQVGDWRFDPAAGELLRDGQRKRLEDRAARTLELLCRERGQVVSHQTLVDTIWNGRALSPNSIAVVIADLRRALGDDARKPRLIETVPKRGYRLAPQGVAMAAAPSGPGVGPDVERRRWLAIGGIGGLLALGVVGGNWLMSRSLVVVGLATVVNETGRPELEPLARSVNELTVTYLARSQGLVLIHGPITAEGRGRRYNLRGRLALWSGVPTVYFSALDAASGQVVWSGMALGPEDNLPAGIDKALTELETKLTA